MVFLITGLQARAVIAGIGGYSISELATSAFVVSAVVIGARFVWIYPAAYVPRWLIPSVRRKGPAPPGSGRSRWHSSASRGIVSLAAALAIPLTTASGAPFRIAAVMLLTVLHHSGDAGRPGLMLPSVIRAGPGQCRAS